MAKILVFQHVAAEPLGTLDPMIRERGHRIRYVNFNRDPDVVPEMAKYHALIVLGGPMMPDQADRHPHLKTEMRCIDQALAEGKPVLGICLGAQLLAHTLGARLRPSSEWEIGWYDLHPTDAACKDRLFKHLEVPQPVFQWHGYSFDLPNDATRLASTSAVENQAFKANGNAYGFQFHLEIDRQLINRWLDLPAYVAELAASGIASSVEDICNETSLHIDRSTSLSNSIFGAFLDQLGVQRKAILPSR